MWTEPWGQAKFDRACFVPLSGQKRGRSSYSRLAFYVIIFPCLVDQGFSRVVPAFTLSIGRCAFDSFRKGSGLHSFRTCAGRSPEQSGTADLCVHRDAQSLAFVVKPKNKNQVTDFFRWLTHTHTMRWHAHYHTEGTGHLYHCLLYTSPSPRD